MQSRAFHTRIYKTYTNPKVFAISSSSFSRSPFLSAGALNSWWITAVLSFPRNKRFDGMRGKLIKDVHLMRRQFFTILRDGGCCRITRGYFYGQFLRRSITSRYCKKGSFCSLFGFGEQCQFKSLYSSENCTRLGLNYYLQVNSVLNSVFQTSIL